MSESKSNVPKLRFPGFTGPWEQRKLGDLGEVAMCKRIYKEQTSSSGDVPFFKIGTFGGDPDAYISNELFDDYKAKFPFPKVGDILISAAGTIGRTVVYQGERAYYQDSNIVWLSHGADLDDAFFLQYLSRKSWGSLEGSTLKRLYNKDILASIISLPDKNEQRAIGAFFSSVDDLIALHQRKLDDVKQLKRGLLQKMFPKEGSDVPEVRFPGFTGPWEQRKLGEVAKKVTTKNRGRAIREVFTNSAELGLRRSRASPVITSSRTGTSCTTHVFRRVRRLGQLGETNLAGQVSCLPCIPSLGLRHRLTVPIFPSISRRHSGMHL